MSVIQEESNDKTQYTCDEAVKEIRHLNHTLKNCASVIHGYLSLIQLDMEEDNLTPETFATNYSGIVEMLERSYVMSDNISGVLDKVVCDDKD